MEAEAAAHRDSASPTRRAAAQRAGLGSAGTCTSILTHRLPQRSASTTTSSPWYAAPCRIASAQSMRGRFTRGKVRRWHSHTWTHTWRGSMQRRAPPSLTTPISVERHSPSLPARSSRCLRSRLPPTPSPTPGSSAAGRLAWGLPLPVIMSSDARAETRRITPLLRRHSASLAVSPPPSARWALFQSCVRTITSPSASTSPPSPTAHYCRGGPPHPRRIVPRPSATERRIAGTRSSRRWRE